MRRLALGLVLVLSACPPRPSHFPHPVDLAAFCATRIVENRLDEAEKLCRQALDVWPQDVAAMHNLGVIFFRRGDRTRAKEYTRAALRVRPDYAPSLNSLGFLAIEAHDWVEAESQLRAALQIEPKYLEARWNLGRVLLKRERFVEAEQEFRALIAQDAGLLDPYLGLAKAFLLQRRYDEVAPMIAKAMAIDEDVDEAWQLRGELDLAQGHPDQAKASYERCLRANEKNLECQRGLSSPSSR